MKDGVLFLQNKQQALAKEEAQILLDITNELNKQLEAQKAIETQIDALQKEDGDVLIWAATSRDANGQVFYLNKVNK